MKTKTISLLLVLAMCLLMLAGCQSAKLHSLSEEAAANGETETTPTPTPEQSGPKDYSAAYKAYPPDQVMLTVDGMEITWGELFYWYVYDVSNMENYFGTITDWDGENSFDSTRTNREYVTENAITTISRYCSLEKKAADMGIELNDVDKGMLEAGWQNMITDYGGGSEKALIAYLEKAYLSKTVYDHISRVNVLYTRVTEEMFGANGEKISDDDLYPVAEDMGYMRAKHILISTVDDTGTELPAEQLAEKTARADAIYAELSAVTDHTALEAKVDEYIASDGEDPGAAYYTDGYTFVAGSGTMDADFDAAVAALEDYQVSEPVKTQFGYHIILRLPLDRDAAVSYTSETEFTTLGFYVAQEMFSAETESWAQKAEVVTTEAYDSIDLAAVFELANKAAEEAAAAAEPDASAAPDTSASLEPSDEPEK